VNYLGQVAATGKARVKLHGAGSTHYRLPPGQVVCTWAFRRQRFAQTDVTARRPASISIDQRSCMPLHAQKPTQRFSSLCAVKTAFMHMNKTVNLPLAAAHSICGTMTAFVAQ